MHLRPRRVHLLKSLSLVNLIQMQAIPLSMPPPPPPHITPSRNRMVRPIEFFRLFFTNEMVESIVLHKNTYAYLHIVSGSQSSYTRSDGSWRETLSDEINRLIALLIYFGIVNVVWSVDKYWSTATLIHGLWA